MGSENLTVHFSEKNNYPMIFSVRYLIVAAPDIPLDFVQEVRQPDLIESSPFMSALFGLV